MPYRSKKPCSHPNCPELVNPGEVYCKKHKTLSYREDRQKRGTASSRGYNYRWQVASRLYLKKNPLCVMCGKEGKVTPATVVDHIIPHRGDYSLFWDESNWQALCTYHHNRKSLLERRKWQRDRGLNLYALLPPYRAAVILYKSQVRVGGVYFLKNGDFKLKTGGNRHKKKYRNG